MSEILVIGHRNPDPDAICSAIGYAEFKRRTGMENAVAARCGDTNERIDFILQSFGVPAPKFVADVTPKVRDVMQTMYYWYREMPSVQPAAFDSAEAYLDAVRAYAARFGLAADNLDRRALQWSQMRGSRSGRVAWQFIRDLAGELGKPLP